MLHISCNLQVGQCREKGGKGFFFFSLCFVSFRGRQILLVQLAVALGKRSFQGLFGSFVLSRVHYRRYGLIASLFCLLK